MAPCSVTNCTVPLLSRCKYRGEKKTPNDFTEAGATMNKSFQRVFPVQLEQKIKLLQCQLVKVKVFILSRNQRCIECSPSSLIHGVNKWWIDCLPEFQSWENRRWYFQAYGGSWLWEAPLGHLPSSQHYHQRFLPSPCQTLKTQTRKKQIKAGKL